MLRVQTWKYLSLSSLRILANIDRIEITGEVELLKPPLPLKQLLNQSLRQSSVYGILYLPYIPPSYHNLDN